MSDVIALFSQRYPLIHSLFTTRLKLSLIGLTLIFAATAYSQYAVVLATADGLFTVHGPIIGGDFIVFYRAALVAGGPQMVDIYEMANLAAILREAYPGRGDMMLGWQYPPTMSLLVKPLAGVPYLWAFGLWAAALGALFAWTLRRLWSEPAAMLFAAASPAVFYSVITGQTGLLTASLLAIAAFYCDRRPIVAGLAAGLLTVKPQLGLLLPIAFAAAGRWRAFAAAAAAAAALGGLSVLAFGVEPWLAFFKAVTTHGQRLGAEGGFPAYKLTTPFGAASLLGAPRAAAFAVQTAASLGLAAYVFVVWRRVASIELRVAALMSSTLLATPYAFYYEAALLVPPMLMIAKYAAAEGWLRGERASLIGVWAAVLWTPGPSGVPAPPVSFAVALAVFLIAARRALPAARLTFSSAESRAPAGS